MVQRIWYRCAMLIAGVLLLAACDLPRDSDGTLDRVRGGTMRVGVVIDTPWTKDSAGVCSTNSRLRRWSA